MIARVGLSIAHISPGVAATQPTQNGQAPFPNTGLGMEIAPAWENESDDPYGETHSAAEWLPPAALPYVQVARDGNLMKLRGGDGPGTQQGGGKRGVVRGLSRQARKRLLEFVASLSRATDPRKWLFLTLTYPVEWPEDSNEYKRHLDTFFKRLHRHDRECAALWKLEYQKRGAPHYHILLYGRAHLDYRWLRIAWFEAVRSPHHIHLVAGTQVDAVQSWNGVAWYAAKYIGKVAGAQDTEHTGRCWGVFNRAKLPREIVEIPVGWEAFHPLRRAMRRYGRGSKALPWCPDPKGKRKGYLHKASGASSGMSLFIPDKAAGRLLRCLPDLAPTEPGTDPARHKSSFRAWAEWLGGQPKYAL